MIKRLQRIFKVTTQKIHDGVSLPADASALEPTGIQKVELREPSGSVQPQPDPTDR